MMKSILLASVLFLSLPAVAETTETTEVLTDTITMPIWPTVEVQLKTDEATAVSFKPATIAEIDTKLLEGVTINGYARKVDVDGQEIGQVVATSVEKDGKEVAISATGFSTQFDASDSSSLTSDESLEVEGSKAELLAALEKLQETEEEEDEKEEDGERTAVEGSATTSETSENDLAGSYTTPEPVEYTEEEAPTITFDTTSNGCDIRIDESQGVAIVQTKSITYTDGVKTDETECGDTLTRYLIKEEACTIEKDLAGMMVYNRYRKYYVDDSGTSHDISDGCEIDTDNPMALSEDETNCKPTIDYDNKIVTFQAALVYTDQNGNKQEARGCEVSSTIEAVELKETTDTCPLKKDIANLRVYETSTKYYIKDGQTVPVTTCTETGTIYTLTEDETNCTPEIDYTNMLVNFRTKLVYTDKNNNLATARDCEVSSTIEAVELKETTELCPLKNDFDAKKSYEMALKYYERDGKAIQVNGCTNTGREFTQEDIYGVCPVIKSDDGKTVTLQAKRQVTIDDVPEFVRDCTPDETAQDIVPTTDGCSIRHDLASGISYQQERFYYLENGKREYISELCQDSSLSFDHLVETVGWDNHDNQKYALPISTVTINTPAGVKTVANNVVLDGAIQQPYVYQESNDVETGNATHPVCEEYRETEVEETWERPDGTFYTFNTGELGDPIGPIYICKVENEYRTYHKARITELAYTYKHNGSHYGFYRKSTDWGSYLTANKGWCEELVYELTDYASIMNYGGITYACDPIIYPWEAYKVTETRQKMTNQYTGEVFYTDWTTQSLIKDCPNLVQCPEAKAEKETRRTSHICVHTLSDSITNYTSPSAWFNCSDYIE